jgi:hypothetical protein
MALHSFLRPSRKFVFPFLVSFFPMIWFVYRDSGVRVEDGQRVMTSLSRTLTLTIVAVVAAYAVAVVVSSTIASRGVLSSSWQRRLFQPTNGSLVALVVLWSVLVGYIALNSTVDLPFGSELVVGIPLLWPLLVAILVTYAVGNAFPVLQSFWIQAAFAVIGLALSAMWIFLLSRGIARGVSMTLGQR